MIIVLRKNVEQTISFYLNSIRQEVMRRAYNVKVHVEKTIEFSVGKYKKNNNILVSFMHV